MYVQIDTHIGPPKESPFETHHPHRTVPRPGDFSWRGTRLPPQTGGRDLPCGVYDPAQAKIEALSVKACMEKYAANPDADFRSRSVAIKEERSHQVKEHLWVLWTDYFKAPHFEAYPQLHSLFNEATKLAGAAGTKGTQDVAVADKLIAKIDEIAEIFWATKKA